MSKINNIPIYPYFIFISYLIHNYPYFNTIKKSIIFDHCHPIIYWYSLSLIKVFAFARSLTPTNQGGLELQNHRSILGATNDRYIYNLKQS